jgi:putative ABC transport system permease protein
MGVLWYKVWYDLWHHKSRTLLAVLSIAVGVFAVGAIFGMVDQMLSGMDDAHAEVNPSHVNIFLRNYVNQDLIQSLKEIDGVKDIEGVNQITIRYKTSPEDKWELGTLVQRDYDKQTYDFLILKEGSWGGDGEVSIERLSSQYFGADIGDRLIFDVLGEERSFGISGKVRHPFVQPPLFGGQAHFFTSASGLADFGIPEGLYGQLLLQIEDYSLDKSREIAADIRSELGKKGIAVVVTLYQEPERHWGRMFVEGINAVMQVMASVSLLLSVILIFNTMTALINQQIDQIGILKSVGARSGVIMSIYFVEVFVISILALMVAFPMGALFAFFMSQWFLNLFNIDYMSFVVSKNAATLQVITALAAPIIASIQPVLRGARMTVREAIATYGLGSDFGKNWIDHLVEKFAALFLSSLFAVSLGNMFRRKGRLSLTVFVLVTSGVMFLVVMTLISSTHFTLDNEQARRGYDLQIGLTRNHPSQIILPLLLAEEGVRDVEIWYSRNTSLLREGERLEDTTGLGAQLVGLPSNSDMFRPIIIDGNWVDATEGSSGIVISQDTADENNIQVGNSVTLDLGELGESTWSVAGTYRVVYGGGFIVEPIYASISDVKSVTGINDEGTLILVKADNDINNESAVALAGRLQDRLIAEGIEIDYYTSLVNLEERNYVDNQFASVITTLMGLAMIAATVGAIGLAGALAISVVERTREIGVLRAMGAQSGIISSLYLMEGALQGLLSWIISIPLAFLLAQPLARLLGQRMLSLDLDYVFNLPAVLIWLAVITVFAVLASILPARAASRVQVRENLSYQ